MNKLCFIFATILISTLSTAFADDQLTCPDKTPCVKDGTCCKNPTGGFDCCPLANATCCANLISCCPSGTQCQNDPRQPCTEPSRQKIFRPKPLLVATVTVEDNECPDNNTCSDDETCCQLSSGDYGCCPYPSAVCCSDKEHCCPQGMTCDVKESKCLTSTAAGGTMGLKFRSHKRKQPKLGNVICPDSSSQCPDLTTCCQLQDGEYGCCPYTNGVCCSDKEHCCPNGTTCGPSSCIRK